MNFYIKYYHKSSQSLEEKDQRIIIVPHEINKSELLIIENKLDQPLVIIEIQMGSYFGEDDIQRYEDDYQRT